MNKPKAVAAADNKLAQLIDPMLTNGEEYTDQGQRYYEVTASECFDTWPTKPMEWACQ